MYVVREDKQKKDFFLVVQVLALNRSALFFYIDDFFFFLSFPIDINPPPSKWFDHYKNHLFFMRVFIMKGLGIHKRLTERNFNKGSIFI